MNIQINILIWTVLCFCAFMLILWRLLLKPILAFTDARKARIAHARSLGYTLVTNNTREFSRVDGLAVVDWLKRE